MGSKKQLFRTIFENLKFIIKIPEELVRFSSCNENSNSIPATLRKLCNFKLPPINSLTYKLRKLEKNYFLEKDGLK